MERIMSDSYRRQLLWDRKMAEMDYRSQMSAAERRGEARGETRGIAIGEARGETRGWNKATKEAEERDRKRVRNMHDRGKTNEEIALDMEISVDKVREWIQ